ncbi:MAG: N-acetyltransferase [Xanthobacteraceae bacterium]
MIVRPERPEDAPAIHALVADAFGQTPEADLVDRLRGEGDLVCSLVAEDGGALIGHVAFSRVWIAQGAPRLAGVSLAPVAVLPMHQRRGVGSALIRASHARLRDAGEGIVFVLGDPAYYQRFGFSRASAAGFDCIYQGEYFQALRLAPDAPSSGKVTYAAAFGGLD